jgi:NADH-quinone oxidoreductase subunit H
MNMIDIVQAQAQGVWYVLVQPVATAIFMIATLAELNRAPFDMPEAEQELTAGYMTEYSGMKFALFFMAEYTKMIAISAIAATLFFGGYLGPFVDQFPVLGPVYLVIKIILILFWMIWVRATWPRIRYDRLMAFGWKVMLPLSLAVVMITAFGMVFGVSLGTTLGPWVQGTFTSVISLIVAFVFTLAIDRALRRKLYA